MMTTLPQAVPFGICTRSVGRSAGGHYILDILDECAKNGMWTIEVAYECLEVGKKICTVNSRVSP
jgi:hypothetical protein